MPMTIKHSPLTGQGGSDIQVSMDMGNIKDISQQKYPRRIVLTADDIAKQEDILSKYTKQQQNILIHTIDMLGVLGKYLSKDFTIPVLFSDPGDGWYWSFKENKIFVDPEDILTKPAAYLRFVIAHEAAHRRITRLSVIPEKLWKEPGYSFMTNAIEDPRINNFITDMYPVLRSDRTMTYTMHAEFEQKAQQKADTTLGYRPRFIIAGLQYISQWFRSEVGSEFAIAADLDPLVQEVLRETLGAAEESWNYYPSAAEEKNISASVMAYASRSFEINRDMIWPAFRRLIEHDLEDQRVAELLAELQDSGDESEDRAMVRSKLRSRLSEAEREALEQAIAAGTIQSGGHGTAIPLESLSDELREKLRTFLDELPESEQTKWVERAKKTLKSFEKSLLEDMHDRRLFDPMSNEMSHREQQTASVHSSVAVDGKEGAADILDTTSLNTGGAPEDILYAKPMRPEVYDTVQKRVEPLTQRLVQRLQNVFIEKKQQQQKSGYTSGTGIAIGRRIKEAARSIPSVQSKAFERHTKKVEHDYAVTLVMDLSSSMVGQKIQEAFKGLVVAAEALDRVGVQFEIVGFNSALHIYHQYGQSFDREARERLSGMLKEVKEASRSNNTDDGWALSKVSERLERIKASKKIVIMCCDGVSNQSAAHNLPHFQLPVVLRSIEGNTRQLVVGLGLGADTQKVVEHFPISAGNIMADAFPETISGLLEAVLKQI